MLVKRAEGGVETKGKVKTTKQNRGEKQRKKGGIKERKAGSSVAFSIVVTWGSAAIPDHDKPTKTSLDNLNKWPTSFEFRFLLTI